jgi:ribonuclease III
VQLELGPSVRLGRGAEQTGGRATPSILATTLEAVLGALYLDGGLQPVRRMVGRLAGWGESGDVGPPAGRVIG